MSKKTFLILAVIYTITTLILNNILHTAIGGFMMTLSLLAFVVAIIGAIYYLFRISIQQFIYNRKNWNDIN